MQSMSVEDSLSLSALRTMALTAKLPVSSSERTTEVPCLLFACRTAMTGLAAMVARMVGHDTGTVPAKRVKDHLSLTCGEHLEREPCDHAMCLIVSTISQPTRWGRTCNGGPGVWGRTTRCGKLFALTTSGVMQIEAGKV